MFTKKVSLLALSLVAMFLMGISVLGQVTTGTMRGTVLDSNNDPVAGATVTVKNEATGTENTTTTNSEGVFEVAQLLPGPYTTTVEMSGFKRSVKTGVQVSLGQVTSSNMALEAGQVSETVTVVASGEETLQTEQAQVTGTIDTRRVEELPSNGAGGGIDTLALLIPGVVANRTGSTNTNGTGLSVNGNRGRSNNFQIDGQDNNDLTVGGPALFVDFQDSVQEFQVVTNNFSAQYGRNQGAIVNIVSKTGTNEFHGTGFLFHRDRRNLDSLTNTQRRAASCVPGVCKPPRDLYNVFGMTFGGPLVLPNFGENDGPIARLMRNKAFFFFGYQGIRQPSFSPLSTTALQILPTDFARLSANFPGNNVINTIVNYNAFALGGQINTFAPSAGTPVPTQFQFVGPGAGGARLAGCPLTIAVGQPVPNSTAAGNPSCGTYITPINPATGQPFLTGGAYDVYNFGTAAAPNLYQAAQYQQNLDFTYFENYWQFRTDVRPTDRDSVSFRYINQTSASRNAISSSNGFLGDLPAGSKNLGGDWTRQITSRLVNTLRLSSSKIAVEFGGGCTPRTPGCVPGPADLDVAFANVGFTGFTSVTKGTSLGTIGQATNLPQGRIGKVKQIADTVNWVRGSHSWMFGYEFKKLDNLVPFLPNYAGAYNFSTASRIINNFPNGLSIAVGSPTIAFPEKDHYFFVQDDWKVRPNLTLNLGVRYEYTGQPVNLLHELSVARESSSKPLFNPAIPIAQRTVPEYPADKNNWAPRIGFAWVPKFWKSIMGEDATVIRGGYSIAYEPAFYNILLNMMTNAPFAASLSVPSATTLATANIAPGTIYALPQNPYGDTIRSNADATGLLPTGQLDPRYLGYVDLDPNFYSPYSQQFSLGIQRQFGRKIIAEARYVGTRGVGLFQNVNNNYFIRELVQGFALSRNAATGANSNVGSAAVGCGASANCIVFPSFASLLPAGTTFQTCTDNPATLDNESVCNGRLRKQSTITTRNNGASSIYHSLQTRMNGRFLGDSLSVGATYTWSKSLDDASEIFAQIDSSSPNAQNPFCATSCERGLSAFDRQHVFTTNFIYDVPFMKEQRGVLGRIFGGWQVNGIYILTSGQVYTPSNGNLIARYGNLNGLQYISGGDRPFNGNPNVDPRLVGINAVDAYYGGYSGVTFPSTAAAQSVFYSLNALNNGSLTPVTLDQVRFVINGPGAAKYFGTPFGNLGRSTERGPIFNQLNLSVFKNIRIAERFRMQLRGEAINFLNHPNPGFGTGSGGAVPSIALTNAGVAGSAFHDDTDITLARRVVQVAVRLIF